MSNFRTSNQILSAQKVCRCLIYICSIINSCFIWEWSFQRKKQKQPSRGVLRKTFSAKQLYWNRTSAWVLHCTCTAYFQNTFSKEHPWTAASQKFSFFQSILSLGRSFLLFLQSLRNNNSLNKNSHQYLPYLKLEISASLKALIIANSPKLYCAY